MSISGIPHAINSTAIFILTTVRANTTPAITSNQHAINEIGISTIEGGRSIIVNNTFNNL